VTPPGSLVRTIFLGSGGFAVPILDALAALTPGGLLTVVTTPARPAGRRKEPAPTPVARRAETLGLPVLTPERLRDPSTIEAFASRAPQLLVVADYGRIVPGAILELPVHGALNLHPSLLPRHRGATPIPAAILAGDRETGVSLIRMDEGIDTGPIVAQTIVPLRGDESTPDLEARLADVAARLLVERLPGWLEGSLVPRPQPEAGASLTRPLQRSDGLLDPTLPPELLERHIRAYQPWPGTFLDTDAGRLIVSRARVTTPASPEPPLEPRLERVGAGVALVNAEGGLELLEVQPAGGKRMAAADWLRGVRALPALQASSSDALPAGRR
jgi:methionyl-tRNA formyltransferase